MNHQYQDLIDIFNQTFYVDYNTKLGLGGDETIYLPADERVSYHRIILHVAFMLPLCMKSLTGVAGPQRRLLEDFGYWYEPDGRTAQVQAEFEKWKFVRKLMSGF